LTVVANTTLRWVLDVASTQARLCVLCAFIVDLFACIAGVIILNLAPGAIKQVKMNALEGGDIRTRRQYLFDRIAICGNDYLHASRKDMAFAGYRAMNPPRVDTCDSASYLNAFGASLNGRWKLFTADS
jgi:hypothetical protein